MAKTKKFKEKYIYFHGYFLPLNQVKDIKYSPPGFCKNFQVEITLKDTNELFIHEFVYEGDGKRAFEFAYKNWQKYLTANLEEVYGGMA